jgi:SAM-dependent methyltransferase
VTEQVKATELLPCYLCAAFTTRLVVANPQYSYLICTSCGLRRQHPLPDPTEDRELYDDGYYLRHGLAVRLEDQPSLKRGLLERRVGLLTKLNGGPGRVLDVGAGTGLFVEASIRAGWRAFGVERSSAAVRFASKITRGSVVLGRVEDLTFDELFDAVTLWDVLEHLPDPRSTLVSIRHLLRPGGLVGIALPNVAGMKARLRANHWRYYLPELGHLTHFSPKTLITLLRQAGFVPVLVETSGAFNLGAPVGMDPVAVRDRHRTLSRLQALADAVAGRFNLGEDLVAVARSPAS